jgi:5-methyltetrahydropteroyltriglutamate--homocysteine methyltransferase
MASNNNTYRADHVGSLLRSTEVLQARADLAAGKISQDQLRAAEDKAITEVVAKQRQIGLDILTDGEIRRDSWLSDMARAVDGFTSSKLLLEWYGPGAAKEESKANLVGAKLNKHQQLNVDETPFLKRIAGAPVKVTLPAPSNFALASYRPGTSDKAYKDHLELLHDVVDIVRDEIQWLISQGVEYVQMDAPLYSHYIDPKQREKMKGTGLDPDKTLEQVIAGDNSALNGIPRDKVTLALHICRGNNRSRWYMEGGYDTIAEKLFAGLDVDRFLLEYDTARSGGFEPLRFVPKNKMVVLGLISSKQRTLESADDIRRRIDQATRFAPLEMLAVSPQCGFASVAEGNLMSAEDQWRKLELVVSVARKTWGVA